MTGGRLRVRAPALLCAVVVGALLTTLPATTAEALSESRPVAVAVAHDGTSYVGFADGGALARLSAAGTRLAPVPLDRPGPVDGLAVGGRGNIWVDYGSSVSLLTPRGHVISHFAHDPASACPAGTAPVSRYGGIVAAGGDVYVAARCRKAIEVYGRGGTLRTTVSLPSTPRGIAWAPAQAGKPARLFVALPDVGQVLTYNAETLGHTSSPSNRLHVRRPPGGKTAVPAGVAADRYGQLVVSDVANHALYFYDANHAYAKYRTLGHPSSPGDSPGSVNYPSAIAQHEQDGGPLSGNLFVADTRNGRIQRWDTGGYTYWATRVAAPGDVVADHPVNLSRPHLSGTAAVGGTLSCSNGTWSGAPTSYARAWLRDGAVLAGRTSTTYVVEAGDAGHVISCRVTARNAAGAASATSAGATIPAGPAPGAPVNTSAPTINGSAAPGQTLTCDPGTWTGGPTYAFAWRRGGVQVATGPAYIVGSGDVGASLTCVVTATNAVGSTIATSRAVVVWAGCVGPVGVSIDAGAVVTRSVAVTLTIRAPAGATAALISNDGGFDDAASRPLDSPACTYAWNLSPVGSGPQTRIVYVRFDWDSQTFTDDIVLDEFASRVGDLVSRRPVG